MTDFFTASPGQHVDSLTINPSEVYPQPLPSPARLELGKHTFGYLISQLPPPQNAIDTEELADARCNPPTGFPSIFGTLSRPHVWYRTPPRAPRRLPKTVGWFQVSTVLLLPCWVAIVAHTLPGQLAHGGLSRRAARRERGRESQRGGGARSPRTTWRPSSAASVGVADG